MNAKDYDLAKLRGTLREPAGRRRSSPAMDLHRSILDLPARAPIAYAQAGEGADVVLVHGALSSLEDMVLALAPALSETLRVTAFDRPGHGGSGQASTASLWRQAQTIHAAVEALELSRPVIIGHSFGGAVAMAYAMQFPEQTAGVIALAPLAAPELRLEHALFAPRSIPGVGPILSYALAPTVDAALLPMLWRGMFLPQAVPERFAELFPFETAGHPARIQADGRDAAWLVPDLTRSALSYWACRTPVQVFGGDRDFVVNNNLHGRLLARMTPNGSYRSLPGLGHMLHHFAQPPIVDAARRLAAA